MRVALLWALLSATLHAAPPDSGWPELALRLTGESDEVRQRSLEKMRAMPNLETELRAALRTEKRHLAIDAIGALKLESLLPDLLALAEEDVSGFVHLGINALSGSRTASRILRSYKDRIEAVKGYSLPMPVQVILIDELGRAGVALDPRLLVHRIRWSEYEVKSAVVAYAKRLLVTHLRQEYLPVLEEAASAKPWQVRAEALLALAQVKPSIGKPAAIIWSACEKDARAEVRELCGSKGVVAQ